MEGHWWRCRRTYACCFTLVLTIPLEGTVTETEFGRTKIGKPGSDSGRAGGSPRTDGFCSEDAERTTGCEMALDVKSVVDGGVKRQEALG